jgi:hypothetical protein
LPFGSVTRFNQPRKDLLFVNEAVGLLLERFIQQVFIYKKCKRKNEWEKKVKCEKEKKKKKPRFKLLFYV